MPQSRVYPIAVHPFVNGPARRIPIGVSSLVGDTTARLRLAAQAYNALLLPHDDATCVHHKRQTRGEAQHYGPVSVLVGSPVE